MTDERKIQILDISESKRVPITLRFRDATNKLYGFLEKEDDNMFNLFDQHRRRGQVFGVKNVQDIMLSNKDLIIFLK